MAKRNQNKQPSKLDRAVRRNWIICAISGIAIIALMMMSK